MTLTDKQRRFVAEYIVDCNATQAAIRAGYSTNPASAATEGHRLLRNAEIAAEVAARQETIADRLGLTVERLLRDQYAVYEAAMRGTPKFTVTGKHCTVEDPDTGKTEHVYEQNLPAANKAVETLMKHRGMFTDRLEVEQSGHVEMHLDAGVQEAIDQLRARNQGDE